MKISLRDYQRDGIRHLLAHDLACLFYDPGLGKTLTTLLAYTMLKRQYPDLKMIVFAPLRIAQTVWQAEIAKWDDTQHFTTCLVHGSQKAKRLEQARQADITIINYEGLLWLEKHCQDYFWDIAVFDELSKMKDPGTRRHRAVRKMIRNFPRRWGLTGTPAPNSLTELFGQMFVIDGGVALGRSKGRFEQTFFWKPSQYSYDIVPKPGAEKIIANRIAPIVHDLRAEEHLDMPDRVDVWHDLEMEPAHQAIYDRMEKDSILEFAAEESVTAISAGVLWGKLQQVCQGFVYTVLPDGERSVQRFDETKLSALEDIIDEAMGQPILVMYRFQEDLQALQRRFPEATTLLRGNTEKVVNRWNQGGIKILLANPQSAAHGLNLQSGGHIMVYYTLESSNERYIQANGRLHRQGQQNTVVIHHLNLVKTVDDDIRETLQGRATMQQRLRERLSRYGVSAQRVA